MKNRTDRVVRRITIATLAIMLILMSNVFLVSVRKVHIRSNTSLKEYADSANVIAETSKALRGNIYDRNGSVIAQDSRTYNIYCILDSSRPAIEGTIAYVKDKETTAKELSRILKTSYENIYDYLNQNVYQTELGLAGRNISQSQMEEIQALNLPGVEFSDSIQRVYPNGIFASNLIGFAQSDESGSTVGKMGAELYLDSYLAGKDGYRIFQTDKDGHVLPGMKEDAQSAVNGANVTLTLDSEIQNALEESFRMTVEKFNPSRVWGAVMEVDTGKILAWGQSPSFDPNTLEINDYNNYGAQLPYEVGSTMKPFTWAAAINEGVYDGKALVYSGPFVYSSDKDNNPYRVESGGFGTIYNANRNNWGWIDYDHGLMYSSNVVAATIETELITPEIYLEYLKKFGFFHSVNSDGMPEETGVLTFHWPMEKLALSYGQGSSCTMLQMLQAYSALFGDGNTVRPYYVDSITDAYDSSKILYKAETKITGSPITKETAKEVQEIMYHTVNDEDGTAKYYRIPECELIGKTGTTQVAVNNTYMSGYTIVSLAAGLPANDPKVIVYYCFEAPYNRNAHYFTEPVQNLLRKTAMRLGFSKTVEEVSYANPQIDYTEIKSEPMPSLINHTLPYAQAKLSGLQTIPYILGSGDVVIDQFPSASSMVTTGQKVFLLTDTNSFIMPDMTGWTRKDVTGLWSATKFGFRLEGSGIVKSQSIPPGTVANRGDEIEIVFE